VSTILALVASGAFYFASTGVGTSWPLAWVAPAPVLWLAYGPSSWPRVGIVAFLAFLIGECNLIPVYGSVVPMAALAVGLSLPALGFAAVILSSRYVWKRLPARLAVLVFPVFFTAWEFVFSLISPNGTAGSISHTQVAFVQFIQISRLVGWLGITFALSLVPSAIAVAVRNRTQPLWLVGITFSVLLVCLGYGTQVLDRDQEQDTVRVGLAVTDTSVAAFRTEDQDQAMRVIHSYARRVKELAARGAQIVVLPEKFVAIRPEWADVGRGVLASAAREGNVILAAGFNEWLANGRQRNVAVIFLPSGEIAGEYLKRYLVPGFESEYQQGNSLLKLPEAIGVAICKDMDFPVVGRDYSRNNVGLLLVPSWDFVKDGPMHARMAVLRGVEGGFSVARTAQEGVLTASDDHGRILAEEKSSGAPEVLLLATLPIGTGNTLYARIGDAFGYLLVLAAVSLLIAARRRRIQAGFAPGSTKGDL